MSTDTLTIWWSQTADTLSCDRRTPGSPGQPTASLLHWCRAGRKSTPSPHPPPSPGEHWPVDRQQILYTFLSGNNVLKKKIVSKESHIPGDNHGLGHAIMIFSVRVRVSIFVIFYNSIIYISIFVIITNTGISWNKITLHLYTGKSLRHNLTFTLKQIHALLRQHQRTN